MLSPYFKSSVYLYWFVCIKLKYSEYSFSYYRDPGKGTVIANSVIPTTPITFIFIGYCLFLMFYRFMPAIENVLGKMYIEGALVSKSHNNAEVEGLNILAPS